MGGTNGSGKLEDLVEYFDAKVLKTWKGSHQPGDVITFARPGGHARCAQIDPDKRKWTPGFMTWIDPRPGSWKEAAIGGRFTWIQSAGQREVK